MRLRDAFIIAWTKFLAHKVRAIISAIITAIMLVILVSMSFGFSGIRNSIGGLVGLDNRNLAVVSVVEDIIFGGEQNNATPKEDLLSVKYWNNIYPEYEVSNVYSQGFIISTSSRLDVYVNGERFAKDLDPQDFFAEQNSFDIFTRSDELLEDALFEGASFAVESGVIPILISTNTLLQLDDISLAGTSSAERVQLIQEQIDKYSSQVIELASESGDGLLKLAVVGIAPSDGLFSNSIVSYIPLSAMTADTILNLNELSEAANDNSGFGSLTPPGIPELDSGLEFEVRNEDFPIEEEGNFQQIPEDPIDYSSMIIELSDDTDLGEFYADNSCNQNGFTKNCALNLIGNPLVEFDEEAKSIWSFLKWVVGLFFVVTAIFLFFTTSKVVGDSRKETGVFRAMGARRADIAKIYFIYTVIITSFSYLLAMIIAAVLMLIVTASQGASMSRLLTDITGSYGSPVSVVFIGFNFLHLIGIWLLSVLVGIVGGIVPILRNVFIDPIKAMRFDQ